MKKITAILFALTCFVQTSIEASEDTKANTTIAKAEKSSEPIISKKDSEETISCFAPLNAMPAILFALQSHNGNLRLKKFRETTCVNIMDQDAKTLCDLYDSVNEKHQQKMAQDKLGPFFGDGVYGCDATQGILYIKGVIPNKELPVRVFEKCELSDTPRLSEEAIALLTGEAEDGTVW